MDDEAGNRRSVTFEVRPCSGSAHLFVRALAKPFPTAESHDYASAKNGQPNSVTLQLLRAHFYISVLGVGDASIAAQATPAEPIRFSIIAKVSGGARYPEPGAEGALAVTTKFTESLLLADDTMEMLVSFVPVPTAAQAFEYRVYTAPNTTTSPCGGASGSGSCVKTTLCGVESAMTPRTPWQPMQYSGSNVTVVAPGLPQNIEQTFVVVGRPVGVNASEHPEQTVVYTATTGTPEYEKVLQTESDDTILITLGIVGGVLVLLFVVVFVARRRLIAVFQTRSHRKRPEDTVDTKALREELLRREEARRAKSGEDAPSLGSAEGDAKPSSSDPDAKVPAPRPPAPGKDSHSRAAGVSGGSKD